MRGVANLLPGTTNDLLEYIEEQQSKFRTLPNS
jgi:hypothetical protein